MLRPPKTRRVPGVDHFLRAKHQTGTLQDGMLRSRWRTQQIANTVINSHFLNIQEYTVVISSSSAHKLQARDISAGVM